MHRPRERAVWGSCNTHTHTHRGYGQGRPSCGNKGTEHDASCEFKGREIQNPGSTINSIIIIRKIIKILATICHILKLKWTKFDSGLGPPRPLWGAYSAPQTHSWIYGALLPRKGSGGEGRQRKGGMYGGDVREGRRKNGEDKGRGLEGRGEGLLHWLWWDEHPWFMVFIWLIINRYGVSSHARRCRTYTAWQADNFVSQNVCK